MNSHSRNNALCVSMQIGEIALTTLRVHRHKMRRWLIAMGLLVVLGIGGAWIFFRVGTWLVVEDPLQPSPVAVVLSGGMPDRAREAA